MDIYISATFGDDGMGNGTANHPYLTIQKALSVFRNGDSIVFVKDNGSKTVLITPPPIKSKYIYVAKSASTGRIGHFSDISSAVNAANDGDTIVVGPGIYMEDVNIKKKNLRIEAAIPWTVDVRQIAYSAFVGDLVADVKIVNIFCNDKEWIPGFEIDINAINAYRDRNEQDKQLNPEDARNIDLD